MAISRLLVVTVNFEIHYMIIPYGSNLNLIAKGAKSTKIRSLNQFIQTGWPIAFGMANHVASLLYSSKSLVWRTKLRNSVFKLWISKFQTNSGREHSGRENPGFYQNLFAHFKIQSLWIHAWIMIHRLCAQNFRPTAKVHYGLALVDCDCCRWKTCPRWSVQ